MPEKSKELKINHYGLSDIGLIRSENQDSFGIFPPDNPDLYSGTPLMFIVADGVGGHAGGKEASSLAVKTISDYFFNNQTADIPGTLRAAIETANKDIFTKSKNSAEFSRMATTSTVLVLNEHSALIGHVGDSKVYKIENNSIEQLTGEHTQLNELLKEGILNEKEAKDFPRKSMLSRALGTNDKIKIDIIENIYLKSGQRFILCSDGLSKVTNQEILQIVRGNPPKTSCEKLIKLANDRGGKDNVTVIVLEIQEYTSGSLTSATGIQTKEHKNKPMIIISVLTSLLIISLLFADTFKNLFSSIMNKEEPGFITGQPDEDINNDDQNIDTTDAVLTIKESDDLKIADQLFSKGAFEKALNSYQHILVNEPMNMGALDGINNIVNAYRRMGDKFRAGRNYKEALKYYNKINGIQPGDEEIKKLIVMCTNNIGSAAADSL